MGMKWTSIFIITLSNITVRIISGIIVIPIRVDVNFKIFSSDAAARARKKSLKLQVRMDANQITGSDTANTYFYLSSEKRLFWFIF